MNYREIFNEIVSIMKLDSATYPDYGAGECGKYLAKITDDMDRTQFLHVVQEYLATFKVRGHLRFSDKTFGSVGFSAMRFDDVLYVTEANNETGLLPGDKITAIDSRPVKEIAEEEKAMLMGEKPEREGELWPAILKFYKTITVEHKDGSSQEIAIRLDTKSEPTENYYYKKYDNDTLYLRFADFVDEQAIAGLYENCKDDLDSCHNLIVDVRGNGGGADTAFFPLIEYCFPADKPAEEYIKQEYPVAINYSERNCRDRMALLKSFFGDSIPEDIAPMVEKMMADLEANLGKGFVDETENPFGGITGREEPRNVWVITDEGCASSGDAFVEVMAFSPKVTVVGRPTAGITDYSNCSMVNFDDFELVYPTSRDKRIDHGKGLTGRGVPVDVYIPWEPAHIGADPELDYVLKKLGK